MMIPSPLSIFRVMFSILFQATSYKNTKNHELQQHNGSLYWMSTEKQREKSNHQMNGGKLRGNIILVLGRKN